MNEIFVINNYSGHSIYACTTYAAAKKYILEEILAHLFDFEYDFESEQDTSREEFSTDEAYEDALKNYITKRVMKDNVFFDEYSIDKIPVYE